MSFDPQAAVLDLNEAEKTELQGLLRRGETSQSLAYRIRIILACAEPGASNVRVAAALGVTRQTVAHWRRRYAERKVEGLIDAPRSGAPRSISDADVERLIALTLQETPSDGAHWTTRTMARRTGMSQTAVSRYWRANGLRPHQAGTLKRSTDPTSGEDV
ncbi:helix-turn-helix domain-containing protein [Methylobacterium oxalidis]|uniref:helix-turn-helix domain-containing protein n=1 Tax=Methylobacterium oxalidis TaxID=944322 RepID=UPI0033161675